MVPLNEMKVKSACMKIKPVLMQSLGPNNSSKEMP